MLQSILDDRLNSLLIVFFHHHAHGIFPDTRFQFHKWFLNNQPQMLVRIPILFSCLLLDDSFDDFFAVIRRRDAVDQAASFPCSLRVCRTHPQRAQHWRRERADRGTRRAPERKQGLPRTLGEENERAT